MARRLGNQALERVLGAERREDAGGVTGRAASDVATVARLGRTLGVDVSDTRVVDDATSHTAADALGASALAAGDTILLGRDAPPPATAAREQLLAHELAHLAQQQNAGAVVESVSDPGEPHELAAEAAAASAMRGATTKAASSATLSAGAGSPPAVQLQTKPKGEAGLDRAEAQRRLEAYFTRVLAQQGGKSVSITGEVKNTLRRIFLNDMSGLLKLDAYLSRATFPGSPTELAAAVAQYLPDPIDGERLAHLELRGPESTTMGRIKSLVQRTEPSVSPDWQLRQWEFEREAKEVRRNDPTVIGPYGFDINRVLNIGKGLPEALKGPKRTSPQAGAPNAALDAAIASVDPDTLTPAAARGSPHGGDFADAQVVARAIAGDLDRAHAGKERSVTLRLDATYAGVKDREAIIAEVARIARLVRDALPHKAPAVDALDLYFGDRLVRRISLTGTAEKTEGSQ